MQYFLIATFFCRRATLTFAERQKGAATLIDSLRLSCKKLKKNLYTCRLEIGPDSPQWVGAWWIGFLMAGVLALIVSVPILAFPKHLPGNVTLTSLTKVHVTMETKHLFESYLIPFTMTKLKVTTVKPVINDHLQFCVQFLRQKLWSLITGFTVCKWRICWLL